MGLIKNDYGVWHVRQRVPEALREAVARVMGSPKERVSWLKKTLGTKDEKRAKVLAKPVMMEFDRIIARAETQLKERPLRTTISDIEIKRIGSATRTTNSQWDLKTLLTFRLLIALASPVSPVASTSPRRS